MKIWEDDFFTTLSPIEKLLFIYYIANIRIGLTGIYEVTDRVVSFETGITLGQIRTAKDKLQKAHKIIFHKTWVYVVNASRLGGYTGKKLQIAFDKEKNHIPQDIYGYFSKLEYPIDTLSANGDTPINHKSEIINNKIGVVKGIETITEEEILRIAAKYEVPIPFVRSKLDDLDNWVNEKPTRARGRDLVRTLMNWVKRDAVQIIQQSRKGVRSVDATKVLHSQDRQGRDSTYGGGVPDNKTSLSSGNR